MSAVDMAESIKKDLAKDGVISATSMKHLATFMKSHHDVNTLNESTEKYN